MTPIWFSHANGFPAPCYEQFFNQFSTQEYRISYIEKTGHGVHPITHGWKGLRNELIVEIEASKLGKVIGIGHSMGAVITLLAALKRPDLFSQIILLDPPIFGRRKQWFMRAVNLLKLNGKFSPASKAKKRRIHFGSPQEAYTYFKPKPLFKYFTPAAFSHYIKYGLQPAQNGNGYELAFSAQKEYRMFCTTPTSYGKRLLQVSANLVYADTNEVLWKEDIEWIQHRFPQMQINAFEGGHLFPFEQPEKAALMVKQLIESVNQELVSELAL